MVRTIVLALALVVGLAGAAQAQDTALITLARKQTQGVEQFSAPSPITAEMLSVGDERLLFTIDISNADKLDPAKSFWFHLYRSSDNGQTWQYAGGARSQGAPDNDVTTPIGFHLAAAPFVGVRVRLELDVPNRMAIGGSVTITRTPPF